MLESASRTQRLLALAGILGPLVLLAGIILASATWEVYTHRTQPLSDLGGTQAPSPTIMNTSLILLGALVLVFALALRDSPVALRSRAVPLLVGLYGAATVIQGLTPCTPSCAEGTVADAVHGLAALTGFLALGIAAIAVGRRGGADEGRPTYVRYSRATGVVIAAFLVLWLVTARVDADRFSAGVHQRVVVSAIMAWFVVTAVQLLRPHGRRSPRSGR